MVLQGSFALMALVAMAAALAPAPQAVALDQGAGLAPGAGAALSQAEAVAEAVALDQADMPQTTPAPTTPTPTTTPTAATVGPSEAQWVAWEDAHGLPKECTPKKEWTIGPHGEKIFTYYADCSMRAKLHAQATLKASTAAAKGKQGVIALAAHAAAVKPTLAADKKALARKALATKARASIAAAAQAPKKVATKSATKSASAAAALGVSKALTKSANTAEDLEPPSLPSMLQKPLPKVANKVVPAAVAKHQDLSAQKDLKKMMAENLKKSHLPETVAQKIRRVFFANKVKQEERKLIAQDDQRAAKLIVDPDEHVANGQWGGAKLKANPSPKLAKLSAKATGPAAAILQMVSGEGDLE